MYKCCRETTRCQYSPEDCYGFFNKFPSRVFISEWVVFLGFLRGIVGDGHHYVTFNGTHTETRQCQEIVMAADYTF